MPNYPRRFRLAHISQSGPHPAWMRMKQITVRITCTNETHPRGRVSGRGGCAAKEIRVTPLIYSSTFSRMSGSPGIPQGRVPAEGPDPSRLRGAATTRYRGSPMRSAERAWWPLRQATMPRGGGVRVPEGGHTMHHRDAQDGVPGQDSRHQGIRGQRGTGRLKLRGVQQEGRGDGIKDGRHHDTRL